MIGNEIYLNGLKRDLTDGEIKGNYVVALILTMTLSALNVQAIQICYTYRLVLHGEPTDSPSPSSWGLFRVSSPTSFIWPIAQITSDAAWFHASMLRSSNFAPRTHQPNATNTTYSPLLVPFRASCHSPSLGGWRSICTASFVARDAGWSSDHHFHQATEKRLISSSPTSGCLSQRRPCWNHSPISRGLFVLESVFFLP